MFNNKEETKEIKKETKDKVVKEEIKEGGAKPDIKLKEKTDKKHKDLNKEAKQAYAPKNIVNKETIDREIHLAHAGLKIKHIERRTYKNGVVKNKLVGTTKA